jgi:hypothetical protein
MYQSIILIFILLILYKFKIIHKARPQNWWPLAITNSFLNDVVKGNTITEINSVGYGNDRITTPTNLNGVYINGSFRFGKRLTFDSFTVIFFNLI